MGVLIGAKHVSKSGLLSSCYPFQIERLNKKSASDQAASVDKDERSDFRFSNFMERYKHAKNISESNVVILRKQFLNFMRMRKWVISIVKS